jgi:hypothetical protein
MHSPAKRTVESFDQSRTTTHGSRNRTPRVVLWLIGAGVIVVSRTPNVAPRDSTKVPALPPEPGRRCRTCVVPPATGSTQASRATIAFRYGGYSGRLFARGRRLAPEARLCRPRVDPAHASSGQSTPRDQSGSGEALLSGRYGGRSLRRSALLSLSRPSTEPADHQRGAKHGAIVGSHPSNPALTQRSRNTDVASCSFFVANGPTTGQPATAIDTGRKAVEVSERVPRPVNGIALLRVVVEEQLESVNAPAPSPRTSCRYQACAKVGPTRPC